MHVQALERSHYLRHSCPTIVRMTVNSVLSDVKEKYTEKDGIYKLYSPQTHAFCKQRFNKAICKYSRQNWNKHRISKNEYYNDMKIFLDFKQDIIRRLKWISREVSKAQKNGKCKAGFDSQMIVGASNEIDKEILEISEWLYNKLNARRVYYSAFEAIKNTPLENKKSESKWREYRLYQCSFLIQKYKFLAKDFVLDDGMLDLEQDPKTAIAIKNELLVDISNASFKDLIKVPGIGIKTAKAVTENRPVKNLDQIREFGVMKRALPFIIIPRRQIQTRLSSWFE